MGFKKIMVPLVFWVMFSGPGVAQNFNVGYTHNRQSISIENENLLIRSEWVPPSFRTMVYSGQWDHTGTKIRYEELAGIPGQRTTDIFICSNIQVARQVWVSDDHRVVAIRQKLSNFTVQPLKLRSMTPLACKTGDQFILKNNPDPANWYVQAQKRLKNEFPVLYRPSGTDTLIADPFLAVPLSEDPRGACLLIGYLDWMKHLASIDLSFKKEGNQISFDGLYADGEFNDVTLPPQGERTTQWIWITIGQDFREAVTGYVGNVATYHHIASPPRDAPSVYCTWYWYGPDYSEDYLLRDLEALKNKGPRKPFDVFLIDECWCIPNWGDYTANEKFPRGMKFVADKIKEAGYIPGIWTPPYLVLPSSELFKKHPDWLLRKSSGEYYTFPMNDQENLVLDPTYPGVSEFLEESFRMLSHDWGFRYFKFDFMRSVFLDGDYKFYDPSVNRLEAYRMGLEAIRRGVGDDAFISVCGGHYGGSLGIANSQRSGSDVVSFWDQKEVPKYRQNIMRTWMSRLWQVDPDAMMVRRNVTPEFEGSHAKLSLGLFTDDEARVNALNQYVGGGLITFTENFASLDSDRLALYRHIIPSVNSSSFPVDWYDPYLPSMMVTNVHPLCSDLQNWNTVTIINWTDKPKKYILKLDDQILESLTGDQFLLFEFFSQKVKGFYRRGDAVDLEELAPHEGCLVKIVPWNGKSPVLAGTDLHFSMGGVEITECRSGTTYIEGNLNTNWSCQVRLTAVFPRGEDGFGVRQTLLQPGQKRFRIGMDSSALDNNP